MTTVSKAVNYTDAQVSKMVSSYEGAKTDEARKAVVESLAKALARTPASIRAKLVSEKVYVKPTPKTKEGKAIVRKSDLVNQIADAMEEDAEVMGSLESATKVVLEKLLKAVS